MSCPLRKFIPCIDPDIDTTDLEKDEDNIISVTIACCGGSVKQREDEKVNEKTDHPARGDVLQSSQSGEFYECCEIEGSPESKQK
jgi:hypothetical protein